MTTETTQEFTSVDAMSDLCRTGLRNVLLACADTKLLLGYHYGEWTFGTPALEAAIANCSLAQTELGHVRLLHAVLRNHYEDDSDQLIEAREPSAFANVAYLDRALPEWPAFVAANYVVDLAVTRVLHDMRDSAFKPLGMSVDKILDEERYHIHHGQGWFRTLAKQGDDARETVQRTVNRALETVVEWFGPAGHAEDEALVEAGIKGKRSAEVLEDLLNDVQRVARDVGVGIEVDTRPDLKGWNPASRRATSAGPEEEILQHLKGSKNEIFKL